MAKRAAAPKKKAAAKKRAQRAPAQTVTKKTGKPVASGKWRATFSVNEQEFASHGESAHAAVSSLAKSLPSMMFKTKAFIALSDGKREASLLVFPIQFRRLQNGRTAQEIWAKKLEAKMR